MQKIQLLIVTIFSALSAFGNLNLDEENFIKAFKFYGTMGISPDKAAGIVAKTLPKQFANKKTERNECNYLESRENHISYSYDRDFIPTIPPEMAHFYATHNGGELVSLRRGEQRVFFKPVEHFERSQQLAYWLSIINDQQFRKILGKTKHIGLNDYFTYALDEHSVDNNFGQFAVNLNPKSPLFGKILVISSSDDPVIEQTFNNFSEFLSAMLHSNLQNWAQDTRPSPADFFNGFLNE